MLGITGPSHTTMIVTFLFIIGLSSVLVLISAPLTSVSPFLKINWLKLTADGGVTNTIKSPLDDVENSTADDALSKNNERSQKQIQISHATSMNRYPNEFAIVKEYVDEHMSSKSKKKFLSFGASTGLEAISLATMYFNGTKHPDIEIYGVDLDPKTLEEAKQNVVKHIPQEPKIIFFNGKDKDIDYYGPYDVIFANSVLCFNPDSSNPDGEINLKNIMNHFNFDEFEDVLVTIDASLREGGLFAMVNSNYHFKDSSVAKRYKTVGNCTEENFVPKVDREKNILVWKEQDKALGCVWMKERSK